ncbi:MAG: transposase [Planctomycetes bacterium]|nr:transposase [Planctomycetota bacterium]
MDYREGASAMQERFSRRRLPHWDQPGATYFVTTCLLGSIPAQGLAEIERVRRRLQRQPRPADVPSDDWKTRQWKRVFVANEEWLDCKPAVRYLVDDRLAAEVVRSLKHFDGERYDLVAWAVMPSHLHWVFRPRDEWVQSLGAAAKDRSPRRRIQHSVNLHTALECNRLLRRTGGFWQRESYDHCVRDEEELERIVAYIHANPVRAGLVERATDFRFSSAREHALREGNIV